MEVTVDDLQYEIKCWAQKYSILERNYTILTEEKRIGEATAGPDLSFYESEVKKKAAELFEAHKLVRYYDHKLQLVAQNFQIQKKELADIKNETTQACTHMMSLFREKLTSVVVKYNSMKKSAAGLRENLRKYHDEKEEIISERDDLKIRVKDLENRNRDLLFTRQLLEQEFGLERESMQKRFNDLSAKIDNLQSIHEKEMEAAAAMIKSKELERLGVKADNTRLSDRLSAQEKNLQNRQRESAEKDMMLAVCRDELNRLQVLKEDLDSRLSTMQDQHNRLQLLQETLQADLDAARRTEKMLRNEAMAFPAEKGDLQSRLRSIQEKVASIERTHEAELRAMQEKLESLEKEKLQAVRDRDQARRTIQETIDEKAKVSSNLAAGLEEMVRKCHDLESRNTSLLSTQTRLSTESTALTKSIKQLEESCQALREDRDELQTRLSSEIEKLRLRSVEQERIISAAASDRLADKKQFEQALKKLKEQQGEGKFEQLQMHFERSMEEKANEIADLKETIRRECEERTIMLIRLSEANDQLNGLRAKGISGVGGGGGGPGGGIGIAMGMGMGMGMGLSMKENQLPAPIPASVKASSKAAGATDAMFPSLVRPPVSTSGSNLGNNGSAGWEGGGYGMGSGGFGDGDAADPEVTADDASATAWSRTKANAPPAGTSAANRSKKIKRTSTMGSASR